jgi:hypothetical protein
VLSLQRRARECTGLLPGALRPETRVEIAGEEVLGVAAESGHGATNGWSIAVAMSSGTSTRL